MYHLSLRTKIRILHNKLLLNETIFCPSKLIATKYNDNNLWFINNTIDLNINNIIVRYYDMKFLKNSESSCKSSVAAVYDEVPHDQMGST